MDGDLTSWVGLLACIVANIVCGRWWGPSNIANFNKKWGERSRLTEIIFIVGQLLKRGPHPMTLRYEFSKLTRL